jgi:hypothetical protein
MKRFLAALTVGLLFGMVITVLGGVAFGAIVGSRLQAESMTRPSADIIVRDETSDDGAHIRFTANADATDMASQVVPASSSQVNQIHISSRQLGRGVDDLAVYVDGTAVENRVDVIQPNGCYVDHADRKPHDAPERERRAHHLHRTQPTEQ